MSSRASSGCLVAIVLVALTIGALTALLSVNRPTRLALGARPYVSLEWTMPDAVGRGDAIARALRRLSEQHPSLSTSWSRVGDTLSVTVQGPGGPEQQDALRTGLEELLPPEFEAELVERQSFERAPRWVGRIRHRVHRIGQRLQGWWDDD